MMPPPPASCDLHHSTWDNKLQRRRYGEYAENYSHDGDSCGIHSSGAGFEKMDPQEVRSVLCSCAAVY